MEQERLFPPASRNTDPETSHVSEKQMNADDRETICDAIVDQLARYPNGLTAGEISELVPYSYPQVWRRCSDAVRMGRAMETGETRVWAVSNRQQKILRRRLS